MNDVNLAISVSGSWLNPAQSFRPGLFQKEAWRGRPAARRRGGAALLCLIGLVLALGFWPGSVFAQGTSAPLLTTFTNPAPTLGDNFGFSMAAVGSDRVLIGQYRRKLAYLFNTGGTPLVTFTYPNPGRLGEFGSVVAAMGSARVLIGAPGNDTVTASAGAVYLFSTNGALLATIANPTPLNGGRFGFPVTAAGSDRVLIGAFENSSMGVTGGGVAYLFALPYPPLSISWDAATISVKWITAETGLSLQQTDLLNTSPVWSKTTNAVSISRLTNVVRQTIASGNTNRFYRLRRP